MSEGESMSDAKAIRAWAASEGIDCPAVGPVPNRVRDAWAHACDFADEIAAAAEGRSTVIRLPELAEPEVAEPEDDGVEPYLTVEVTMPAHPTEAEAITGHLPEAIDLAYAAGYSAGVAAERQRIISGLIMDTLA